MGPLHIGSILFIVVSAMNPVIAAQPEMLLCLDSMSNLKKQSGIEPQKLVYGYVNGKKTPCMTENEFRSRYSSETYNGENRQSTENRKKQNRRDAVYHGEKNLANSDLRGFDLQGLDLTGANLENANLESADLRNTILRNANLKGANLENSYCKNAILFRANLTGTKLRGAFLNHANLLETEGLSVGDLCTAATLYKAILESSVVEVINSNCPVKLNKPAGGWTQKEYPGPEQDEVPTAERADPRQFR